MPRVCFDLARRLYRAWGCPQHVSAILAEAEAEAERTGLNKFGPSKHRIPGIFLCVTAEWVRNHVTLTKGRTSCRAIRCRYIWDAIFHRILWETGIRGGPSYGAGGGDR